MFRFACSVALRGGRGAADRYRWPVRGALAVFWPHWVCLAQGCVLHVYTAQAPGCSMGAGPALRAVPVYGFSTKAQTQPGLRFVPSRAGAAQATRSLASALSPGAGRLLPSEGPALGAPCVCSGELVSSHDPPADVNHPESQEVFGQKLGGCLPFSRGCLPNQGMSLGLSLPLPPTPASCLPQGMGWSAVS